MRRSVMLFAAAAALAGVVASVLSFEGMGPLRRLVFPASASTNAQGAGANGKAAPQPVSVVTATAATADFAVRRYAIGFVSSPAVVDVSARIASQIVAIPVKDGQTVKAGDVLFRLDDRSLKAQLDRDQATLLKDQALLTSAQADLERARNLANKQAGTKQAYDQALATEKSDEANVAADQAMVEADEVQLGFATITAPISGRLGVVNVAVGDLVPTSAGSGSTPLVTITQMDPLEVMFNLPEADLPLLKRALASRDSSPVRLYLEGSKVPAAQGTLEFIDSSVDTASGTVAVKAGFPNKDQTLWPGQYVDIVLDAGVLPAMTSIPTAAVQPGQRGPFVYVVKADGTVEVRPVKIALADGANSAVSEGLAGGERVVTEGQTRLKDGTPVRDGSAQASQEGQPAKAEASPGGKQL